MKRTCVITFLLLITKAYACLNIFAVDSTGRVHYLEHYFLFPIEFKQKGIEKNLKKLEKKFRSNDYGFQNFSDYGAYLLMAGRFAEGLDLFRALTKKYPAVYEISANMAVAYELNGLIDSAILWQKAALELKPDAHNRSEWIHLRLLEAKRQLLTDPDWCLHHNVTGVADSIRLYYQFSQHEDGKGMWIFHQFVNQLKERFPFTYAEDKAMGKMMFELGNAYKGVSVYRAYYCYAIAKYLYPSLRAIVDKEMKEIRGKYPENSVTSEGRTIMLTAGSGIHGEMLLPEENEVEQFIRKIIDRPALKSRKIKSVNTASLISKI